MLRRATRQGKVSWGGPEGRRFPGALPGTLGHPARVCRDTTGTRRRTRARREVQKGRRKFAIHSGPESARQAKREGAAQLHGHDHEAESSRAFQPGKPAGDGGGNVRKRPGFTDAKRKAHGDESPKFDAAPVRDVKDGPPEDDAGQNFSRAKTVGQEIPWEFQMQHRQRRRSQRPNPTQRGQDEDPPACVDRQQQYKRGPDK